MLEWEWSSDTNTGSQSDTLGCLIESGRLLRHLLLRQRGVKLLQKELNERHTSTIDTAIVQDLKVELFRG